MDSDHAMTALRAALASMLPTDIAHAAGRIGRVDAALFEIERAAIARAVPRRRAEFQAGRALARRALRDLGVADQPIPIGPDRRPLWPRGVVGAITHTRDLAVVAVARSDAYLGLGLDLEPALPLETSLLALVGRPEELDGPKIVMASRTDSIDRGKLIFCVKEAVFKAVYPTTLTWFDFQDAVVTIDPGAQSFAARLIGDVPSIPGHPCIEGRFTLAAGHIVVVTVLPVSTPVEL